MGHDPILTRNGYHKHTAAVLQIYSVRRCTNVCVCVCVCVRACAFFFLGGGGVRVWGVGRASVRACVRARACV